MFPHFCKTKQHKMLEGLSHYVRGSVPSPENLPKKDKREEDRWLKRSGTNCIIVQNAEIFKQYQFVKEKEFVKENEEAFEILRNILIFELESSNSVNYSADMCRSCPFTYYVPILKTRVLAYLCTLLGLGFLPRFPRRLCGCFVTKRASIGVLVLYTDFVHVFPAYCASFWPVVHRISMPWAWASFSCFFSALDSLRFR